MSTSSLRPSIPRTNSMRPRLVPAQPAPWLGDVSHYPEWLRPHYEQARLSVPGLDHGAHARNSCRIDRSGRSRLLVRFAQHSRQGQIPTRRHRSEARPPTSTCSASPPPTARASPALTAILRSITSSAANRAPSKCLLPDGPAQADRATDDSRVVVFGTTREFLVSAVRDSPPQTS